MGQLVDGPSVPGYPYPAYSQVTGPFGSYTSEGPILAGWGAVPGQWLLKKARREYGIEQKRAQYMNGALLIPTGTRLMEIEYQVNIWESLAMSAFTAMCSTILQAPAVSAAALGPSAALGIHDPILKMLGVTAVCVTFVDPPKNPLVSSGGRGPWVGAVGFIEYVKILIPTTQPSDQTIPEWGPVTPEAASANLATAGASVTAGAGALQGAAASALIPPR